MGGSSIKTSDFLIVGSGLFGSITAHLASKAGNTCLVIDKRLHQGETCTIMTWKGFPDH